MTEIQYVQAIRDAAKAYMDQFADDGMPPHDGPEVRRWEHIKTFIAPSTAIAMAEAWLKLQDAAE